MCGLKHEPAQKHLLLESTLSLAKAIKVAQSLEVVEMNALKLKGRATMEVMRVKLISVPKAYPVPFGIKDALGKRLTIYIEAEGIVEKVK